MTLVKFLSLKHNLDRRHLRNFLVFPNEDFFFPNEDFFFPNEDFFFPNGKFVFPNGIERKSLYRRRVLPHIQWLVPTYRCNKDEKALEVIQECFPDRKVVGIDSVEIIWGLGSFHCLSQQEPEV